MINKFGRKAILTFLIICTIAQFAFAEEKTIKPFGKLEWTDCFNDTVLKLNSIEGIEKIELDNGNDLINIKGITDKEVLSQKLGELIEKRNPFLMNPEKANGSGLIESYTGKDNKEKKYVLMGYLLKASPIIICGTPFNLSVRFDLIPGVAIKLPDCALTEKKMSYSFPLVIKEVTLTSDSPNLKEKYKEIAKILHDKYIGIKSEFNTLEELTEAELSRGGMIYDNNKNSVNISLNETGCNIVYENVKNIEELNELYNKHLANIENNKNKGKKDMGADL